MPASHCWLISLFFDRLDRALVKAHANRPGHMYVSGNSMLVYREANDAEPVKPGPSGFFRILSLDEMS
jgi:hypothetical protein